MRRVYDIAGELHVPVLIHFEEGGFNSGIRRLPDLPGRSACAFVIFTATPRSG